MSIAFIPRPAALSSCSCRVLNLHRGARRTVWALLLSYVLGLGAVPSACVSTTGSLRKIPPLLPATATATPATTSGAEDHAFTTTRGALPFLIRDADARAAIAGADRQHSLLVRAERKRLWEHASSAEDVYLSMLPPPTSGCASSSSEGLEEEGQEPALSSLHRWSDLPPRVRRSVRLLSWGLAVGHPAAVRWVSADDRRNGAGDVEHEDADGRSISRKVCSSSWAWARRGGDEREIAEELTGILRQAMFAERNNGGGRSRRGARSTSSEQGYQHAAERVVEDDRADNGERGTGRPVDQHDEDEEVLFPRNSPVLDEVVYHANVLSEQNLNAQEEVEGDSMSIEEDEDDHDVEFDSANDAGKCAQLQSLLRGFLKYRPDLLRDALCRQSEREAVHNENPPSTASDSVQREQEAPDSDAAEEAREAAAVRLRDAFRKVPALSGLLDDFRLFPRALKTDPEFVKAVLRGGKSRQKIKSFLDLPPSVREDANVARLLLHKQAKLFPNLEALPRSLRRDAQDGSIFNFREIVKHAPHLLERWDQVPEDLRGAQLLLDELPNSVRLRMGINYLKALLPDGTQLPECSFLSAAFPRSCRRWDEAAAGASLSCAGDRCLLDHLRDGTSTC